MITFCIISCLTNWNVSLNTISLPKSKGRLLTHIQLVVYQDSQGLFCHFINIYEASSFQPGLDFRNSCKKSKNVISDVVLCRKIFLEKTTKDQDSSRFYYTALVVDPERQSCDVIVQTTLSVISSKHETNKQTKKQSLYSTHTFCNNSFHYGLVWERNSLFAVLYALPSLSAWQARMVRRYRRSSVCGVH